MLEILLPQKTENYRDTQQHLKRSEEIETMNKTRLNCKITIIFHQYSFVTPPNVKLHFFHPLLEPFDEDDEEEFENKTPGERRKRTTIMKK